MNIMNLKELTITVICLTVLTFANTCNSCTAKKYSKNSLIMLDSLRIENDTRFSEIDSSINNDIKNLLITLDNRMPAYVYFGIRSNSNTPNIDLPGVIQQWESYKKINK